MRLVLVDLDGELADAWTHAFDRWIDEGAVEVRCGSILDVLDQVDAVISAGNSYGQMDGGVDRVLAQHWPGLQRAVWAFVADQSHGYLPVGTAAVVATGDDRCRSLIYAPTMRVPMSLAHGLDVAVHDAFWAALLASESIAGPDTSAVRIAAPGFGTGFGQVRPERAAQLMAAAYTMWRSPPTAPISDRESLLASV